MTWSSLKGLHRNDTVVVAGLGPSTALCDQKIFRDHPVIGVTKLPKYLDPDYLITGDAVIDGDEIDQAWRLSRRAVRFAPEGLRIDNYTPVRFPWSVDWQDLGSDKIVTKTSVVLIALQLAIYFEARRILLVGCDGRSYQGRQYCYDDPKETKYDRRDAWTDQLQRGLNLFKSYPIENISEITVFR